MAGQGGGLQLAGITVFPLKGGRGIRADRWPLDAFGPWLDRRWMVTEPDGSFVSQRSTPALARVETALEAEHLVLGAPGEPEALRLPLPDRGADAAAPGPGTPVPAAPRPVEVWGARVAALPATDPPERGDAWASRVLGRPLHLVVMPPSARRPLPPEGALEAGADGGPPRVGFADGFPLLVVTEASLEELDRRLRAAGEVPVPMDRFRPNLVVAGARPHEEDTWAEFRIGDVPFRGVKGCARCAVTTVDQATGRRVSKEPLRTLATYRRSSGGSGDTGKVWFGQNAVHLATGELAVGMAVTDIRRGPPVGPPPFPPERN